MRHGYLNQLTGLRFIAALAVLIAHMSQRNLISIPSWLYDALDGGRVAVTFFFVLSGFILAYTYSSFKTKKDVLKFYLNRFARLYPVLVLSLVIGIAATLVSFDDATFFKDKYSITENKTIWLAGSFLAQALGLTAWLPSARLNQPFNSPAWSVSAEFFFYALFPAIVVYLLKRSNLQKLVISTMFLALQWILISGFERLAPESSKGFLIYQFPLTHLTEFILGAMACSLIYGNVKLFEIRTAWVWGAQSMMLVTLFFLSMNPPLRPMYFLMTPVFAFLIATFALPKSLKIGLGGGIAVLLGEASYSLYMVHIPLLNLLEGLQFERYLAGGLVLLLLVLTSVLVHKLFEVPMRNLIRRNFARQK